LHDGALPKARPPHSRRLTAIIPQHAAQAFHAIAGRLHWPASATLKDFRHLFASLLANCGMPEPYRQYLMGHATTAAVIGTYTHLNKVKEHYLEAVRREWQPLVDLLQQRLEQPSTPTGPPQ
jgi:integrase